MSFRAFVQSQKQGGRGSLGFQSVFYSTHELCCVTSGSVEEPAGSCTSEVIAGDLKLNNLCGLCASTCPTNGVNGPLS